MLRTTRRVAVIAALGTTFALGGAASASAATSIGPLPASAPIVNKLYVPVTMTLSCDAIDPFFWFASAYVTIRQVVSGKKIAHGTAYVNSLTCDGTPRDYTANVFPDTTGMFPGGGTDSPPFAKGDAVISAQLSSFDTYATAGPQSIRLTK